MGGQRDEWKFGGRHYRVTLASTPESIDLELDDVGPGLGRGTIALASLADDSATVMLQFFAEDPLPLGLVERFVAEALRRLPGA